MIGALTTLQQWLLFTGTMLVTGAVAWRTVVAPGAALGLSGNDAAGFGEVADRVRRLALSSLAVLVLAWSLRLVVQVMGFRDPFVPLWDDVSFLLFELFWGTVWMAQGGVLLVLGAVLFLAPGGEALRLEEPTAAPLDVSLFWKLAGLLVVGLATTLAMSGHAMGADSARTLVVAADAMHTLAAGVWIGTLAVIVLTSRGSTGAMRPVMFGAQIRTFSPLALVSGGTLVLMGIGLSWAHLTAISDLWSTSYGRILSAKVCGAGVVFLLGFLNWRQGVPVSDTDAGATAVRRRAVLEVSLAVGVVLLTAILVHSTKP